MLKLYDFPEFSHGFWLWKLTKGFVRVVVFVLFVGIMAPCFVAFQKRLSIYRLECGLF